MIFRNQDSSGDWVFGKGGADYLTLNAAIGLNIKTRLLSWLGDCFFAQTEGVDWRNRLGSKNQLTLLSLDLRRIISQSSGVTGIVSFNVDLTPERVVNASYTVDTIYSKGFTDSLSMGGLNA